MPRRGLRSSKYLTEASLKVFRETYDDVCIELKVSESLSDSAWSLLRGLVTCVPFNPNAEVERRRWIVGVLFSVGFARNGEVIDRSQRCNWLTAILPVARTNAEMFIERALLVCSLMEGLFRSAGAICSTNSGEQQSSAAANATTPGELETLDDILDEPQDDWIAIRKSIESIFSTSICRRSKSFLQRIDEALTVTRLIGKRFDWILGSVFNREIDEYKDLSRLIWSLFIWAKVYLHHSLSNKHSMAITGFRPSDYTLTSLQLLFGVIELVVQDCHVLGLAEMVLRKDVKFPTSERFLCSALYPPPTHIPDEKEFPELEKCKKMKFEDDENVYCPDRKSVRHGYPSSSELLCDLLMMNPGGVAEILINFLVPLMDSQSHRWTSRSTTSHHNRPMLLRHPILSNFEHNMHVLDTEYGKALEASVGLFDERDIAIAPELSSFNSAYEFNRSKLIVGNAPLTQHSVEQCQSIPIDMMARDVIGVLGGIYERYEHALAILCGFMGEQNLGTFVDTVNNEFSMLPLHEQTMSLLVVTLAVMFRNEPTDSCKNNPDAQMVFDMYVHYYHYCRMLCCILWGRGFFYCVHTEFNWPRVVCILEHIDESVLGEFDPYMAVVVCADFSAAWASVENDPEYPSLIRTCITRLRPFEESLIVRDAIFMPESLLWIDITNSKTSKISESRVTKFKKSFKHIAAKRIACLSQCVSKDRVKIAKSCKLFNEAVRTTGLLLLKECPADSLIACAIHAVDRASGQKFASFKNMLRHCPSTQIAHTISFYNERFIQTFREQILKVVKEKVTAYRYPKDPNAHIESIEINTNFRMFLETQDMNAVIKKLLGVNSDATNNNDGDDDDLKPNVITISEPKQIHLDSNGFVVEDEIESDKSQELELVVK